MQDAHENTCAATGSDTQQGSVPQIPQGSVVLATIAASTDENGFTAISLTLSGAVSSVSSLATSIQPFKSEDIGKTVACVQPMGAVYPMIMGPVINAEASERSLLETLLLQNDTKHSTDLENEQQSSIRSSEDPGISREVEIDFNDIAAAELQEHDAAGLLSIEEDDSDPERLILRAQQAVVIKCGESSISLEADGRIRLNGRNIFSRASHLQRIAGGAIKLN